MKSMVFKYLFVLFSSMSMLACSAQEPSDNEEVPIAVEILSGKTISSRIPSPGGFLRKEIDSSSFAAYLRSLPLKPEGSPVLHYNAKVKSNQVHAAVIDMEIGKKDLHQCADAIMRLKAEYHWHQEEYDKIHFNFTNGDRVDYTEWMNGRRIVVDGNKTKWIDRFDPSNTYANFWSYMETIFMYAGTSSLSKELAAIKIEEMEIGDIFIQGGFPGHAVMVVDMAINEANGKKVFLLGQSYMPAQDFHVLINKNNNLLSPWYELDNSTIIYTPEWSFNATDLMRFQDLQ